MRSVFSAIILAFVCVGPLSAQSGNDYGAELSKNDIKMNIPDGFSIINIDKAVELDINPDFVPKYGFPKRNIGWAYSYGVESADKDCVILYPTLTPEFVSYTNVIEDEIQAYKSDPELDVTEFVDIIAKNDMSNYANADTVAVYDLELAVPYLDRYSHCVGLFLRKYGHPGMVIKVLTDDKGLTRKDELVQKALNSVAYGDTPTEAGLEGESRLAMPLKFPMQRSVYMAPEEGYIN